MRRQSYNQKGNHVIFYAIFLVLLLGIGFVITRDIEVPTEHVSQDLKVILEQ